MCRIIVDVDVFQRRFEAKMISAEKCFFLIFNAKESTFCFALLSSLSLGRSTLLQHIDPSKPCCCLEGHNTLSLSLSQILLSLTHSHSLFVLSHVTFSFLTQSLILFVLNLICLSHLNLSLYHSRLIHLYFSSFFL